MFIQKRKIYADEEVGLEEATVSVEPEAADLLFEAEDVAELIAEVTEEPVEVEVADDGGAVTFAVGEDEFTVEAEGDEEILEAVKKPMKNKRTVKASAKRKPVKSSRTIRKVPSKKRK